MSFATSSWRDPPLAAHGLAKDRGGRQAEVEADRDRDAGGRGDRLGRPVQLGLVARKDGLARLVDAIAVHHIDVDPLL